MEDQILKELQKFVKSDLKLEIPPDPKFGDYSLPCFTLAKEFKKNPNQIAQELKSKLKLKMKMEVVGGYLNFFVDNTQVVKNILTKILKEKNKHGSVNIGKKSKIVIDYSSPNIAKPFGIGHLRSTIIGNSLNKIFSCLGYKCIGVNHLGDWGTQFGKLIVAYKLWGDPKKVKEQSISHLFSLYVKFHQEAEVSPELEDQAREWFNKLEKGNKEALKLWKWFKDLSLAEFKKYYKELEIKFDSYQGEAFYNDKLESTVKMFKKYSEVSDGALVIPFDNMPPVILKKSDGASTYHTRDLAALLYRVKKYKPNKIMYVVGTPQNLHFEQLFRAYNLISKEPELVHINFGHINFKEGKMSTRKGNIIFLEEVLDNAIELALKTIDQKNPKLKNKKVVAKDVGIGAIVFGDLINDRIKDVIFDWDRILDFEGDTGPYVQYGYVRTCSILKKAKSTKKAKYELLSEKEEIELIKHLGRFNEIISKSAQEYRPSHLARYLIETVHYFNNFYEKHRVISDDKSLMSARLSLVKSVNIVLENGLKLLGMKTPTEM